MIILFFEEHSKYLCIYVVVNQFFLQPCQEFCRGAIKWLLLEDDTRSSHHFLKRGGSAIIGSFATISPALSYFPNRQMQEPKADRQVHISMYDISTKVVMRTHALCIPTRPYNLGFQKHLQTLRLTHKKNSFSFFKKKLLYCRMQFCI